MKRNIIFAITSLLLMISTNLFSQCYFGNCKRSTDDVRMLNSERNNNQEYRLGFEKVLNTAQYKGSDYRNAIRVERHITLDQAYQIAEQDPEIEYFFYTKGGCMVLELPEHVNIDDKMAIDPLQLITCQHFRYDSGHHSHGYVRVFGHGDAVFFKNAHEKWLGSAKGLADTYIKIK